jgi:hypothetical protein
MPTEEQSVDEQLEQPQAGEPVPKSAPVVEPEPQPEPPEAPAPDIAAALAKQRAEFEETKIENAELKKHIEIYEEKVA